ncbi:hypothetical protein [Cognatilysobacter terrigena]|uniref:hypothetical protein n=1 Tax=Cognatilysobacter terrigena TaxID=2488749 RepID=UPI001060B546|nr:hypothetical protein [Lysobacter terrigena]
MSLKTILHRWTAVAQLLTVAVVLVGLPAIATANVRCTGTVTYLGVDQAGGVVVANGSGMHTICNTVTQGNFQANPQACKIFYATLLAVRLADRPVSIYYNDPALTSCTQIGAWSVQPSAYFVEQSN